MQKTVHSGAPPQTYSITVSDQFYYEHYYGHHTTLSIGDVILLQGIPEGAIVCNVEHHVGDRGTSTRASKDYAIVISHNPNNGTWTGALPAKVWPPWLMDVSDISSNFMNWPI